MIVVADDARRIDRVPFQEYARRPGIFCGDERHFSEYSQRTESDVFHVADRRRDQVKRGHWQMLTRVGFGTRAYVGALRVYEIEQMKRTSLDCLGRAALR